MIEKIEYNLIRNNLETGDLVFFSGSGFTSEIIKKATISEWSHVGMVISVDILDNAFSPGELANYDFF